MSENETDMDENIVHISLYEEKILGRVIGAQPICQVYADGSGLISVCDGPRRSRECLYIR